MYAKLIDGVLQIAPRKLNGEGDVEIYVNGVRYI